MKNKLSLSIITPEKTALPETEIDFVALPALEGELGVLSGLEENTRHGESTFTDPRAVSEFVRCTGVDSLAISIGTSHGVVKIR
jgi:fructose/tagatose bisphosphate aldolase